MLAFYLTELQTITVPDHLAFLLLNPSNNLAQAFPV